MCKRNQDILHHRSAENKSFAEIAEIYGCTEAWIKRLYHDAVAEDKSANRHWTSDLSPRAMNSILNHYCPNFTMIADEEEQQKSKPTKELIIKDIYTERLRLAAGMGKITIAELCTYLKIPYPAIKITPAQWRAFNRIMYVHHCPDNTKTVAPAFIEYIKTVRPILETEEVWFDILKDTTNRIAIKMLEVCLEKRPKRGRRYIHAIIGDE